MTTNISRLWTVPLGKIPDMKRGALGFPFLVVATRALAQSPESTITDFVAAFNSHDWKAAAKLVKNGTANSEIIKMLNENAATIPRLTLSPMTSKVTGAVAKVSLKLTMTGDGAPPPKQEVVKVEKVGSSWLIVPGTSGGGLLNNLSLVFASQNYFATAKEAAKNTVCLSNLKQLAVAVMLLLSDTDDVFKLNASNWKAKIIPYVKNEAIFSCPHTAKGAQAYSFNGALAGKNASSLKDPASVVLLYEGKSGKLTFHPDGKAAIAFADGHAKRVTASDAKKLKWKP